MQGFKKQFDWTGSLQKQRGFTLIELVIVIVLIGILAATALPKFADLTGEARTAAARGVGGALGAAASVAHSQWLATGSQAQITMEGGTVIVLSTNGWPECGAGCTSNNTPTAAKCIAVWNGVLSGPPTVNATAGAADYQAGTAGNSCTFTDEGGNGTHVINYDVTTGIVTVT